MPASFPDMFLEGLGLVGCVFTCPGNFAPLYTTSHGFYFYYLKIAGTLQRAVFENRGSVLDFISPKDKKHILKI